MKKRKNELYMCNIVSTDINYQSISVFNDKWIFFTELHCNSEALYSVEFEISDNDVNLCLLRAIEEIEKLKI